MNRFIIAISWVMLSLISVRSSAQCMVGWLYDLPITITNTNVAALTNFQVKVTLNTQSIIAGGRMQANGADIRFTNATCSNLPYWIENNTINKTQTVIWVKVSTIPPGSSTIHLYYGSPTAPAAQDGASTFEMFDDFNNLNSWTQCTNNSWGVTTTVSAGAEAGSFATPVINGCPNNIIPMINPNYTLTNGIIETRFFAQRYLYNECNPVGTGLFARSGNCSGAAYMFNGTNNYGYGIDYVSPITETEWDTLTSSGSQDGIENNIWYRFRATLNGTELTFNIDEGSLAPLTLSTIRNLRNSGFIGFAAWQKPYIDWVFVRKYTLQQPTTSNGTESMNNRIILLNNFSTNVYCAGTVLPVLYSVYPTANAGNIFSAELSDATGSFATPVVIGTLTGTTSNTMGATIPPGTPAGSGYKIRVTSSNAGYTSTASIANLTINPIPTVSAIPNITVCEQQQTATLTFTGNIPGGSVVYNWTNSDTSIGLAANGSGDITSFIAKNATNAPKTATVTVTPSYTNAGTTCTGSPVTFDITVNPTPVLDFIDNQLVCNDGNTTAVNFSSPATGGTLTYNWTNNAPSITQPAAGTGNIASFISTNTTNIPTTAIFTATPSFTNNLVTCVGSTQTFSIITLPTATVNPLANLTFCSNTETDTISFSSDQTGGDITYEWENNNPSIGLAASGSGHLPSFTTINNGDAPLTATITATPSFENNGVTCTGDPVSFTITVNPMAVMDTIASQIVCNQEATTTISFSSDNTGGTTTYSWTNSQPSIGLAANGSGNSIPSFTAVNNSQAIIIATISITPSFTNGGVTCVGATTTTMITVNPTPVLITHDTTIQSNGLVNLTAAGFTAGSDPGLTFGYWNNALATAAVPDPTAVPTGTYYITAQNGNGCSDTASVQVNIIPLRTISGKVYNDIDGLNGSPSNTINGSGTNAGNLRVVLVANANDSVINVQNVAGSGDYFFNGIKDGSYRLIITTTTVAGYTLPAMTLAQGWVHTGEFYGASAGNDGSPDGILNLGMINGNVSNAKFGIEQPPVAGNSSGNAQLNPGSNSSVTVNGSAFACSDPSPGAVRQIRFTGFPANAVSAYIGFNSYTAANWPAQGVTVTTIGNQPLQPISVDPINGPVTVNMPYVAIDAAGFSSNIATVSVPFSGITLSGIVHNDIDGLMGTPSNTVNGPGITVSGMHATLLDAIADTVVAITPVVNGNFSFTGRDIGYYSVRITNGTSVVGSTLPIVTLPAGWAYTGEKNGTGTGTDGFADGKLYLGLQQANNTQIHFGIQQLPTAVSATAASQLNPGGNNTATVPAATFVTEDALPGAVTSLYFSGALPVNAAKLVLNGTAYTATNPLPPAGVSVLTNTTGQPIQPVLVDPANGNVTVSISYKAVDASGMMSTNAIASVPFSKTANTNSSNKNNEGAAGVESNQDITGGSALASYRVSIYPNPASDRIYIKADDFKKIREIKLLDIRGRKIHAQKDNFQDGINMSNSVAGTYIVKVIFFNGLMKDFKVVKK